jgi:hypothetical protein
MTIDVNHYLVFIGLKVKKMVIVLFSALLHVVQNVSRNNEGIDAGSDDSLISISFQVLQLFPFL